MVDCYYGFVDRIDTVLDIHNNYITCGWSNCSPASQL